MEASVNIIEVGFKNGTSSNFVLSPQNIDIRAELEGVELVRAITKKLIPVGDGGVRLIFDFSFDGNIDNNKWLNMIERCLIIQNSRTDVITLRFGQMNGSTITFDDNTLTEVIIDPATTYSTRYVHQYAEESLPFVRFQSEKAFNLNDKFFESIDGNSDIVIPKYYAVYNR